MLTGVIAALLAQGLLPWDAARLGVALHARAGDLAADASPRGLIASDLFAPLRQLAQPVRRMSVPRLALGTVDEAQLNAVAARLAAPVRSGGVIHLAGDLGAGKTTFARALLRALGVGERIKSPTYSLIESYRVGGLDVHHLDLYRIAAPGELEWLGLADLDGGAALIVVEWPERGVGALPAPDLRVELGHADARRDLLLTALSRRGREWLAVFRDEADENPE